MAIMELGEKLAVLAGAAKYDASCASSGSGGYRGRPAFAASGQGGFGGCLPAGVCHSWTQDGRCVSLLKVLYSNVCRFDCAYCVNRVSSDIQRASFTTGELVDLTTAFYRRNYIEGLFLSSGIFSDADIVMERLIGTAKKLRKEAGFGGYIHLKIIPGAGEKLIREAGLWADRLSANIELPTEKSLVALAPQKSGKLIFGAMRSMYEDSSQFENDKKRFRFAPDFAPAGQSTQLIVGASEEDDKQIISLSGALYRKFSLRRVYYSAFIPPVGGGARDFRDPRLPDIARPPLLREHRLYQADWLMRFYSFAPEEILEGSSPYLDTRLDPKTAWALRHIGRFPIDISRAGYQEILRVPGIGTKSALRILGARKSGSLTFDSLRKLGVALRRARYFITLGGAYLDKPDNPLRIRRILSNAEVMQLPLFDVEDMERPQAAVAGGGFAGTNPRLAQAAWAADCGGSRRHEGARLKAVERGMIPAGQSGSLRG
ncbi:MAG: putative DNA modification/repair radical SAM protein [Spirochaetales bacterium]|jgi:putative DNA modification/repair radical SAM protein|nr:putative DNA modification/repair radical SAM protein [Spirochaetales bacterium]